MKLKDSTFAIIAEKKDSISHKWFNENLTNQFEKTDWTIGHVFEFEAGRYRTAWTSLPIDYEHNIYNETQFEALLKAEQENELKMIGDSKSTGENAQTFPKNTIFGKEGIAHKHPISEMKDPVKSTESNQVTFTYQTAINLLAYYTKIDKGIIKIEMP